MTKTQDTRRLLDQVDALLERTSLPSLRHVIQRIDAMEKELAQEKEWRTKTLELTGTTHIGNAHQKLKALAQNVDTSNLPAELKLPPAIWMNGRKKKGKDPGFAGMSVREATKQHRWLLPVIVDAWALTYTQLEEVGEASRANFLRKYQTESYDVFSRECFYFVNDLEEPEIDITEAIDDNEEPTVAEMRSCLRAAGVLKD